MDRPKRKENFKLEEVGGEILLYHPETAKILYCNETAKLIWQLCNGSRTEAAVHVESLDKGKPLQEHRRTAGGLQFLQERPRMMHKESVLRQRPPVRGIRRFEGSILLHSLPPPEVVPEKRKEPQGSRIEINGIDLCLQFALRPQGLLALQQRRLEEQFLFR